MSTRAATPVEVLSAPSSVARPPRGTCRRPLAVAFGGLIEQTELRFPALRCRLFPGRNHPNHFAGRYPVYVVARTNPVRFRDSPRQSHLVFGCNFSHAFFQPSILTIARIDSLFNHRTMLAAGAGTHRGIPAAKRPRRLQAGVRPLPILLCGR